MKILKQFTQIIMLVACFGFGLSAQAVPIFTNSSVVTSPTNTATFDALVTDFNDLTNYTEDGIRAAVPSENCCSSIIVSMHDLMSGGVHYGNGGNTSWVTISMVDDSRINALDFILGDGFTPAPATTNLIWETFDGITSTGFGDVVLTKNTVVGWTDTSGFTSLRVAANSFNIDSFGEFQAIALDDLRIGAAVPEPATLALFGIGLAGIGFARKKKKSA